MAKKVKLMLFVLGLVAMSAWANFVLAADFGIEPINNVINLATGDPRVIAVRIIQILLTFLGLVALVLIIYAGFLWMTSSGEEDKITQAKRILKNAFIGLLIIISSWAITTFIIAQFLAAIGGSANIGGGGGNLINPGLGAIGACTVESFYPENGQTDVARNTSIIITFKEKIKTNSGVCVDENGISCTCDAVDCNKIDPTTIRIYKNDLGDACSSGTCPATSSNTNIIDAVASVSTDFKTLVLVPTNYLGNPITNVLYSVKITSDLKKDDGINPPKSMFKTCYKDYFQWGFEVGTRLDLTPPRVVYGKIFPRPDNIQDLQNMTAPPVAARGLITVNSCPNYYQASKIISVAAGGGSLAADASPLNYQGNLTEFKVAIAPTSTSTARLFDGNNNSILLGSADFDSQNNARFGDYFTFHAPNRNLGNSWIVTLSPEILADSLTVGNQPYVFYSSTSTQPANYIYVDPLACDVSEQADKIATILNGHNQSVNIQHDADTDFITLTAKVAGADGNNIAVSTTNPAALRMVPLTGGKDRKDTSQINDKKDVPMNSVIQINFSEAVNPLQVAGLASEVSDYIRVVNASSTSRNASSSCSLDSQCKSYKCQNLECVGNYIAGKFLVSNVYRTVEFISDNECGMNGCGEKIYCLPANSHLKVEMKSADLKSCLTSTDCIPFSPFNTCSSTLLTYKTCQNSETKNYPTAAGTLNGIIDTAINSFDGDRSVYSDGPLAFYNDNNAATSSNIGDNYLWTFYVNDIINLNPPVIQSITPTNATEGVTLVEPIKISWNSLMMNSSLTTGSRVITTGTTSIVHKLLNLWSAAPTGMGYWVASDNLDTNSDGEPDKTDTLLKHSTLSESMSYRAQAGSGLRDIYQNCFKPSAGAGCAATSTNPSCCSGVPTSTLGLDGNCQ